MNRRELFSKSAAATVSTIIGGAFPFGPTIAQASSNSMIKDSGKLSQRLLLEVLTQPKQSRGIRNNDLLLYPSQVAGMWNATMTLANYSTPLGLKFLGGPSGLRMDVAQATVKQQEDLIGKHVGPFPLNYRMISVNNNNNNETTVVVEDGIENLKSRTNAFAEKDVVKSISYVGPKANNNNNEPTTTTLMRFKGPIVQKTFSTSRDFEVVEEGEDVLVWTGFETTRTLLARTDLDLPPVVSDSEVITQLVISKKDNNRVMKGRVRIAGYLNPNDALYFEARQRAVSISDYDLVLTKI